MKRLNPRRDQYSALKGSSIFAVSALLAFGSQASAAPSLGYCTAQGGTLGTNLFSQDGSFGVASAPLSGRLYNDTPLPTGYTSLGFVSSTSRVGTSPVGYPPDGNYVLVDKTNNLLGAWWSISDHTRTDSTSPYATNGAMMMINASQTTGSFYTQTLTVLPNTNYEVGLWAVNVLKGAGITPNIAFDIIRVINGVTYTDTIFSRDIPQNTVSTPPWTAYGGIFNTGPVTQLQVRFRNNAPGGGGNDLAIDDLTFTPCNSTVVPASVQGNVFADLNLSDAHDAADQPVSGLTVQLVGAGGLVAATTQTDAAGNYQFNNVPPGSYNVRVPKVWQTSVAMLPKPALSGANASLPVTVASGQTVTGINFGYQTGYTDLKITKTQSLTLTGTYATTPLTQSMGVPLFYQLVVTNAGPLAAAGVTATDTLPGQLQNVKVVSTAPSGSCTASVSGNTVTVTANTLAASAPNNTCTVTLSATGTAAGTFQNTASLSSLPGSPVDYDPTNNAAPAVQVRILDKPQVTVTKRVRTLGELGNLNTSAAFGTTNVASPGQVIEYCLTVANAAGVSNALNLILTDPLPRQVSPWLDGYGTGLGVQRKLSGATSFSSLTSQSDSDAGTLDAAQAKVSIGTLNSGTSADACFRAFVK